MIWVESNGGPLAVIAEAVLPAWSGWDGDYDRACAVDDIVGVIPFGTGAEALILGDDPAGTTYLPANRALVRWIHGESDTDVPAIVESGFGDDTRWAAGPVFTLVGPPVLFDSAFTGPEAVIADVGHPDLGRTGYDRSEDGIRLDLPPGTYRVESADLEPDSVTCLRVHRFIATT